MIDIKSIYGELVFSDEQMLKYLGPKVFKTFKSTISNGSKEILDLALADKVAAGMKK
jgi:glutamine synthetase type III